MALGTVKAVEFARRAKPLSLAEALPAGRLTEISGRHACARTSTAVSCVVQAQSRQELVAWVQFRDGGLFPPDLAAAGVDLQSLIVVQVPGHAGPFGLARAAEWLARSGAFSLTVVDLSEALPPGAASNWQGRLQGLLRQYGTRMLLLTSTAQDEPSSGPLVGLRIEPKRCERSSLRPDFFEVRPRVLKDKVGLGSELAPSELLVPDGFF
jgi:recombination protein RecA